MPGKIRSRKHSKSRNLRKTRKQRGKGIFRSNSSWIRNNNGKEQEEDDNLNERIQKYLEDQDIIKDMYIEYDECAQDEERDRCEKNIEVFVKDKCDLYHGKYKNECEKVYAFLGKSYIRNMIQFVKSDKMDEEIRKVLEMNPEQIPNLMNNNLDTISDSVSGQKERIQEIKNIILTLRENPIELTEEMMENGKKGLLEGWESKYNDIVTEDELKNFLSMTTQQNGAGFIKKSIKFIKGAANKYTVAAAVLAICICVLPFINNIGCGIIITVAAAVLVVSGLSNTSLGDEEEEEEEEKRNTRKLEDTNQSAAGRKSKKKRRKSKKKKKKRRKR